LSLEVAPVPRQPRPRAARLGRLVPAAAVASLVLLILTLPLARHWMVVDRTWGRVYYEFTSFGVYLSDAGLILVIGTGLATAWMRPRSTLRRLAATRSITLPLVALVGLATLTAPWARDQQLALYFAGRLALLVALYVAIVVWGPPRRAVQLALAASLVFQSAVAIAQFARQSELAWYSLGEVELSLTSGYTSVITAGGEIWLRGYGLTPHPNILGGILAAGLLALTAPYLRNRGPGRAAWLVVLLIAGAGLLVTFSRAAWLGGAVAAAVFIAGILAIRPWRQRFGRAALAPALAGVIIVVGFAAVRWNLVVARLRPAASETETRSITERQTLVDASLTLIQDTPVTGVGAGGFSSASAPLLRDVPNTLPQPVHNLPLLLTAELGVLGGALWVWLMAAPVGLALRAAGAWRSRDGPQSRPDLWTWSLTAGLIALAITDLFDFYCWGWPQGRLLRWTFLGLWGSAFTDSAG
jgi:O-antigen ligase